MFHLMFWNNMYDIELVSGKPYGTENIISNRLASYSGSET